MSKKNKKSGNDKALAKLAIITAILTLLSNLIALITKLIDLINR